MTGFNVTDFYSHELLLVLELDCPVHLRQKEYDHDRDSKLSDKGNVVLRIKNEELEDKDSLISKINKNTEAQINKIVIISMIPLSPFC